MDLTHAHGRETCRPWGGVSGLLHNEVHGVDSDSIIAEDEGVDTFHPIGIGIDPPPEKENVLVKNARV
jgi:hypothetical protein